MLAPAMETRRVSCFTRGRGLICKIIPQQHAAMVVDESGRAIRIREMHQVPQLDVPVTHTRFIGYDPVQHPAVYFSAQKLRHTPGASAHFAKSDLRNPDAQAHRPPDQPVQFIEDKMHMVYFAFGKLY